MPDIYAPGNPMVGPPQSVNPLGMIGQLQNMQLQGMQIQSAQQQLKARMAMGPAMQASIDPQTGQPDFHKFLGILAGNPNAAWMVPQMAQDLASKELVQQDTLSKTLANNQQVMTNIGTVANQLVGTGMYDDPQTSDAEARYKTIKAIQIARANGQIPDDNHMNVAIAMVPQTKSAMRTWASGIGMAGLSAADQIEKTRGAIQWQNTGGQLVPTQTNQIMGTTAQGPAIQKTLTPGEYNTPQDVVNPSTGNTSIVPRGQLLGLSPQGFGPQPQQNPLVPPVVSPQGQNGPSPVVGQGNGSAAGGVAGPLPAALPGGQGPAITKLGPGAEADIKNTADLSKQLATNAQDAINLNQLATSGINQLSNFTSGPGKEVVMKMAEMARAAGMNDMADKLVGGSLSSVQDFRSNMMQLATGLMKKALEGGGRFTNTEFLSFQNAKAGINLNPEANKAILEQIKFGAQLAQQQNQFMSIWQQHQQAQGKTPSVNDFQTQWSKYANSQIDKFMTQQKQELKGQGQ